MIDYRVLSYEEKLEVLEELKKAELFNLEIIKDQVVKGNYCSDCFMIYYNCLCSHED